jgi:SpoVK/Ycf46/Vps4 family AAA+-type ATPase
MEKNIKLELLESIGRIYEQAKKCKLKDSFFEEVNNELVQLSAYFKTTKSQSFFVATIFALNYKGDMVDLNDLIKYFNCNPMKILEYSDDFEWLCDKGILIKQKSYSGIKLAGANSQFTIHEKITEAILQGQPMPETGRNDHAADVIEFLEKIYKLGQQRDDGEIVTGILFARTRLLIMANKHLPLVHKTNQFDFSIADTFLYFYLVWKTLSGRETTDISKALEGIFDDPVQRINFMQGIQSGNNRLLKEKLIEVVEANFLNDLEMKLTDKSEALLKECGITLALSKRKRDNIISHSNITFRQMVFNKSEMEQLKLLKGLLSETKFIETRKRLENKGMPNGITVLLHGAPGTGKTETVKQLAKETNRDLMKVEISRSKSMWFGESEKITKRIFTDYKSFAKECERVPILLFNEADAIISKRKDIGHSTVDQTENAIQNILLEELENFDGILIATTNLVTNLDTAFDRRFLFKIEFHQPDSSNRAKIWKLKMPFLSNAECQTLAAQFNLSGGQIDNIVRKSEMHEIVHGEKSTLENLITFCSGETLLGKTSKIGFS